MAIILPILAVFDAILAGNLHYTACGKRYGHKLSGQSELQRKASIMSRCGVGRCRYQREVALEIVVEIQGEHAAVGVVGTER